jgi:predicted DNA-binding protein with PD1-like motif
LAGAKTFYEKETKVEILSLSGTLSANGSHLHLCVADSEGHCVGGHLSDGCIVNTTAEIVISEFPKLIFKRAPDAQTGFEELVISKVD